MAKKRSQSIQAGMQLPLWLVMFALVFMLLIGFIIGLFSSKGLLGNRANNEIKALRLSGYKFINPLLACDASDEESSPQLELLAKKVKQLISSKQSSNTIDSASVYFRDYNRGESVSVNPEEKFYPASLSKIPMMIALYKMAESDRGILDKKTLWDDKTDYNATQEIKPKELLQSGNSYTNQEAVEKMIKYSDNNAFYFLAKQISPEVYRATYSDLRIPLRTSENEPADFLAAKDFSYFLRVLYNSTYLKREYSEKALEMLSSVDFKEGITKQLPAETMVAHKYGLKSNFDGTTPSNSNELHDCGFVYGKQKPYLLCVMTKSSSSLTQSENTIAEISELVYKTVGNNYQE